MKLLLDQNVSFRLVATLEPYFPGTEQVKRLGLMNKTDKEIWDYARQHEFILLTFDSDYYDLSVTLGSPPKLIWLKTGNLTRKNISEFIISKFEEIKLFYLDKEINCLELQ